MITPAATLEIMHLGAIEPINIVPNAKKIKHLLVVLCSVDRPRRVIAFATLNATIDDVRCSSKGAANASISINRVWLKETCGDLVHAWPICRWSHVEP